MSDIANAPAPSIDAPVAAPANEVPINPNPVNPPSPIDDRLPAEEQPQRRPSRMETIENAFRKRSLHGPSQKPPRPRWGTISPPRPIGGGGEVRPAPAAQGPAAGEGQVRLPRRRHLRKVLGDVCADSSARRDLAGSRGPSCAVTQLPEHAPYRAPPPRMHPQAQAEWHAAPESVRGEVYRMAKEFNDVYQRSQADVQEMESIRQFQQMARQHGTTLQKALHNYTGMEQLLRTDLVAGLDLIINNLKLRSPDGQPLGIRDVAYHILNLVPRAASAVAKPEPADGAEPSTGATAAAAGGT